MHANYEASAPIDGASDSISDSSGRLVTRRPASASPLLIDKHFHEPSVFKAESMLREARRQKGLALAPVPRVCVLDPDGDIVRRLKHDGRGFSDRGWACYHTEMIRLEGTGHDDRHGLRICEPVGFVGCAVGAPFAVLVAEQLFACGCELLISIASAGQLDMRYKPTHFLLIERALRDEGTSHHYLEPTEFSRVSPDLHQRVKRAVAGLPVSVENGSTWTTDAPFRETGQAIAAMRAKGLDAVEMEAAALYAFAEARDKAVVCFAQITNSMGQIEGDFEKGEANGAHAALTLIAAIAQALR